MIPTMGWAFVKAVADRIRAAAQGALHSPHPLKRSAEEREIAASHTVHQALMLAGPPTLLG